MSILSSIIPMMSIHKSKKSNIPANTIRMVFADMSYNPGLILNDGIWTLVDETTNTWDWTNHNKNWSGQFQDIYAKFSIIGNGQLTVTNMSRMFMDCGYLTSVELSDLNAVTNMESLFAYCYNLSSAHLSGTKNVTNMARLFKRCVALTDVSEFNTSKVLDMESMYEDCDQLTLLPSMDTSSVTNINKICRSCSALREIPELDISNVTTADRSFEGCWNAERGITEMYQKIKASSKITNHIGCFSLAGRYTTTASNIIESIDYMYGGYEGIDAHTLLFRFDKEDFDPHSVSSTYGYGDTVVWTKNEKSTFNEWFAYCESDEWYCIFECLAFYDKDDDTTWVRMEEPYSVIAAGDTSSVTITDYMFANDGLDEPTDLCGLKMCVLFDTRNVGNTYNMFESNNYLDDPPKFNFVCELEDEFTDAFELFYACHGLTEVPHYDFHIQMYTNWVFEDCDNLIHVPPLNVSSVYRMNGMFYNCTSLKHIPQLTLNDRPGDDAYSIDWADELFENCVNITEGLLDFYNYASNAWKDNSRVDVTDIFTNCALNTSAYAERNQIPMAWGGELLDCCAFLARFENPDFDPIAAGLKNIYRKDEYSLHNDWYFTSRKQNGSESLINIDEPFSVIGGLNLDTCEGITDICYNCNGLVSVTLGDMPNAEFINNPTYYCKNCKLLSIGNLPKVTDIALNACYAETVIIGDCDILPDMYYSCQSAYIKSFTIGNVNNVTNISYMFYKSSTIENITIGNCPKVTNTSYMCYQCTSLKSITLNNSQIINDAKYMFYYCGSLTTMPVIQLAVGSSTNVNYMFYNCKLIASGILAMYNYLANTIQSSYHNDTFYNCGSSTSTGYNELMQIPLEWR